MKGFRFASYISSSFPKLSCRNHITRCSLRVIVSHMTLQPCIAPRSHQTRLRKLPQRPPLSIEQVLQWADAYFTEHG